MRNIKHIHIRQIFQRSMLLFVATVFMMSMVSSAALAEPEPPSSETDISSFVGNTAWYDPTAGLCTETGVQQITPDEVQANNAKIVIGVAKTMGLGQRGALIGLMTALTESNLKNYANTGVPVSRENPMWLSLAEPRPLGNDHDSVGIMQQRVSGGRFAWSTFGRYTNGSNPQKDRDITWQLMNPAYAAQAFFGVPSNVALPEGLADSSALRQGLQNLGNWQSLDPGEAAQKVQISAFPARYNQNRPRAQSLLDQLWDSSPEITLPIPLTGDIAPDSVENYCANSTGSGGSAAILEKIKEYAWANYRRAGTNGSMDKKDEYQQAVNRAPYKGGCNGIDCGAFVSIVMRESGADPTYNEDNCNTRCQLAYLRKNAGPGKKYTKVNNKADLQPGDIAIRDRNDPAQGRGGHTFFFVGTAITEDAEGEPWTGGQSASSSLCERAPMASSTDTFELYEWYHLN